ncbi:4Fe-4S dicluster domain-containing protein, partial [Chloroflexota bacterium]
RRGVEYAAGKGLAVVVMEPLRGGKLAGEVPEQVAKIWATAAQKRTPAEWALLWTWNQPEVSLTLSGMSAMEQVVENVAVADRSGPGVLMADELALFDRVREAYYGLSPIPCTDCGYCIPCPNGVKIPNIFQIYNEAMMYGDLQRGRLRYNGGPRGLKEEERADQCKECGECVKACPQEIPIPEWLKKVHALLGSKE